MDSSGEPLVLVGYIDRAVVFQAGRNRALAEDFVRFLVGEGEARMPWGQNAKLRPYQARV
jgi:hypothetical protein